MKGIRLTLDDCVKAAKAHDGYCLSSQYFNCLSVMKWECRELHIFDAPFDSIRRGRSWCPECAPNKKLTQEFVEDIVKSKDGYLLSRYESIEKKLKVRCNKDGHIWHTTLKNIKKGVWCPKCAKNAKIDIGEVEKFINNKGGTLIDATDYKNSKSYIKVRCDKDGYIWKTTWDYLKQRKWCPKCAGKVLLTYDELCSFVSKKDGTILSGPKKFIHSDKFVIKCNKDGYIWETTYNHLTYRKFWCPKCSGKVLKTYDEVKDFVESKGGRLLSPAEDLKRNTSILRVQCNKDKYIWTPTYSSLINSNRWCPKCGKNVLKTYDEVKEFVENKGGKLISPLEALKNSKSRLDVDCGKGHQWSPSYGNLMRGRWCPQCQPLKEQKELMKMLSDILHAECLFNYKGFDWFKDKKRMEIDIWIPEIKLGVEYDGIYHFRPVVHNGDVKRAKKAFKDRKKKDALKNKLIKQHPEDVKFFIRFDIYEKLTLEYVKEKLEAHNVPMRKSNPNNEIKE